MLVDPGGVRDCAAKTVKLPKIAIIKHSIVYGVQDSPPIQTYPSRKPPDHKPPQGV
jgi:hypothetical protein